MTMTRGNGSSHELAQACLETRIAFGDIAHCSGKAEDFGRDTRYRLQRLWGLDRYDCYTRCSFDLMRNHAGDCRAIIDTDIGYFDHMIPQSAYDKFESRLVNSMGVT